jgi:hypothetical protein
LSFCDSKPLTREVPDRHKGGSSRVEQAVCTEHRRITDALSVSGQGFPSVCANRKNLVAIGQAVDALQSENRKKVSVSQSRDAQSVAIKEVQT